MLGSALIVFREVLEASLIIGIACAATRAVPRRAAWVTGGVLAGAAGACLVALFAEAIAGALEGMGQEVFNASILLVAVGMLGWHNVWMSRHGREMAQEMSALGRSVESGSRPLYALGLVIALAVLREGSEVVLFLYGIAAGGSTTASLLGGAGLGLAGGAAVGVALYFGLLRIPQRHLFAVTSWMILLLAAGMASQAARFLIQADFLPPLGTTLWDSSHLVAQDSLLGQVLRTLIGYDTRPSGMQLLFYLTTLITIGAFMKLFGRPAALARAAVAAALAGLLVAGVLPDRAEASPADKVYSPQVEYGETEVELRGGYLKDDGAANAAQAYVLDIGRGFTPYWFTELVTEAEKEPGESLKAEELEWENLFQLTEIGRYFMDVGLFSEIKAPLHGDDPWAVEAGPMFQKEFGRLVNNLNVLAEREFGTNADHETRLGYRFQSRYLSGTPVELGLQALGEERDHVAGPAIFGMSRLSARSRLKWDAGILRGLTTESENWRLRWQAEFEFF